MGEMHRVKLLCLGAVLALTMQTAVRADDRDAAAPTAIEQALVERACSTKQASTSQEPDQHERCLATELDSLRADFGRDLNRLPKSGRRKVDATCGWLAAVEDRQSYLDCVSGQLGLFRSGSNREAVPVSAETASAESVTIPEPHSSRSRSLIFGAGAALAAVIVGALAFRTLTKRRHAAQKRICRSCGADMPDSGALCPSCRHEAAEAMRRAAAQRATEPVEHDRRQHEQEQRRLLAQEEEQERQHEEQRLLELREAARQREEEAQRARALEEDRRSDETATAKPFDPYSLLGVEPDADPDEIQRAYQEAKRKYCPDWVTHLSDEVQQHFKAKAEDVERAYRLLETSAAQPHA